MTINDHLKTLLYSYDCVIIPGFGGFVARYFPAEIQEGTYIFRPPSKRISFNARLKENDGLLAHFISQKEGISYHEAVQMIEINVRAWNRILESGNKISLEGIGKIYTDSEGNLQFTPSLEANFLTTSYGLGLFRSPAITDESIIAQSIKQQALLEGKVYENRNASYFMSNIISALRVASVILVVGSVFYLAIDNSKLFKKSETDSFSYIGFGAMIDSNVHTEPSGIESKDDKSNLRETERTSDTTLNNPMPSDDQMVSSAQRFTPGEILPIRTTESSAEVSKVSQKTAENPITDREDLVKISVGVFGVEANAMNLRRELSQLLNISADIESTGKFLRVVALCNKNEADQILLRIKESVAPDAFVMK